MQVYLRSNIKVNLLPHVAHVGVPAMSRETVMELANFIAERERGYAPVLTGALRDSIHVEERGQGASVSAGGEGVDYHWHQEFGTVHHGPHPYARPAAADGSGYQFAGDYTAVLLG